MNSVLRALILALFTLPAWAEVKVEMLNPPENAWSKQVDNVYRLKLNETIKTYQLLIEPAFGELRQDVRFQLATTADEAKQKSATDKPSFIVNFDEKQALAITNYNPYLVTIGVLSQVQMAVLSKNKLKLTHEWLRLGTSAWLAHEVMDKQGSTSIADVLQAQISWLRETEDTPDAANFLNKKNDQLQEKGFLQTTMLMTHYLKSRVGPKFLPAFANYLRAASKPEFNADQSFEQQFGLTLQAFLQGYQAWTQQIKAAQYQHNQPVPPTSAFATLEQNDRYPLRDDASMKLLEQYRAARKPKALAISTRGTSFFASDRANAISMALKACAQYDPVSCRLYAVDDAVVYQQPKPGLAQIEIRMASLGDDGWTMAVREKYMPAAQQAAEAFRALTREKLGAGLDESVRIHLVSGMDDYSRVLQESMNMPQQYANTQSVLSGGLSNNLGQIAFLFSMGQSTAWTMKHATKNIAHELVHEWQGQQSHRYQGFKAPAWIVEGAADLLAIEAIESAHLPDTQEATQKVWFQSCIDWYHRDGTLQPDDVLEPEGATWMQLMSRQRGPYELSGLMVYRLRDICGEKFHHSLTNYFQLASQPGQKEEAAFEQSFGLSRAAFLDNYKAWVKTL